MNRDVVIAQIAAKHKILLNQDDPAFILVDINRIILEECAEELFIKLAPSVDTMYSRVQSILNSLEISTQETVKKALDDAKSNIDHEIESARMTASTLLERASRQAHGHHFARWTAIGIFACLASISAGFAIGHTAGKNKFVSALSLVQQTMLSPEGSAAADLAMLGQARTLLECSQIGWKHYKDYCYPLSVDGKVVGWRIR